MVSRPKIALQRATATDSGGILVVVPQVNKHTQGHRTLYGAHVRHTRMDESYIKLSFLLQNHESWQVYS